MNLLTQRVATLCVGLGYFALSARNGVQGLKFDVKMTC